MAFNLIAESPRTIDWGAVLDKLRKTSSHVELVPIPSSDEGVSDAIGLALPSAQANAAGWGELQRALEGLWSEGFRVIELYSGKEGQGLLGVRA